jgi:SnoaL-like domain
VLESYPITHPMMTNIVIEVNGKTAKSRHYLQAIHVPDPADGSRHADLGGLYDNTYVIEDGAWKFETGDLSFIWTDGLALKLNEP